MSDQFTMESLREGSARPWIVACTAARISNDVQELNQCGMNDVLLKPFTPAGLKEMLGRARAGLSIISGRTSPRTWRLAPHPRPFSLWE